MEFVILGLLALQAMTVYEINKALERGVSLFYSASFDSINAAIGRMLEKDCNFSTCAIAFWITYFFFSRLSGLSRFFILNLLNLLTNSPLLHRLKDVVCRTSLLKRNDTLYILQVQLFCVIRPTNKLVTVLQYRRNSRSNK